MGTSGAVNTNQNGQNGGPGQSVTADAGVTIPNTNATNTATAYGGQGGSGGNGGGTISGLGAGGNGGLGGNATAQSMTSISLGDGTASSYAQGGTGGFGGSGGQFEQYGQTGAGSNAGNATATAFATAPGNVTVTATAVGGQGGQPGVGSDALAGADGGTATLDAQGISTGGGSVTVIGTLRGGNGGEAGGGFDNTNTNGGNGIDAGLENNVSGSTTGTLTLEQIVYGGNAGIPIGLGQPSLETAGAATSSLSYSGVTASVVNAYVTANGGSGAGALEYASGGNGNTANASANISGIGAINVTADANGGTGGNASGTYSVGSTIFSYQAGNGTTAMATASGTSTTGQPVVVTANQTGGDGGTGYVGSSAGNGADSIMNNAVSGATSGGLTLIQQASAGNGALSESGSAGLAGMAVSNLTVDQDTETGGIIVQSTANGGMGGSGWQYNATATNATQGGNASASVNVTDIGDINASVSAFGGPGGNAAIGAGNCGNGGFGTITAASATSTGPGAHTVMLTVTEQGGDGGEEPPPGGPGSVPPVAGNGGSGQSASLNGVANPNVGAAGTIFVLQNAIGGSAGQLYDGGTGSPGTAGSGTAVLALARDIANLNVTDDASGGYGADATITGPSTNGGNAYASSSATDNAGTPNAYATAQGGTPGATYNSQDVLIYALPGTATALAVANSTLDSANPTASATATGYTPGATATITTVGGGTASAMTNIGYTGYYGNSISNINVDGLLISATASAAATATGNGYAQTQTIAFVAEPTPTLSSAGTFQAAVIQDCIPTAAQAAVAIGSTHPNSAAAVAGSTDFLGMTVLSDMHSYSYYDPVAASETQSSNSEYVFDLSDLPSNTRDLVVCLLDNQISGAGFATLDFQIDANGSLIPGQNYSFTSPATAATFFSDNPINLGPITNFGSGGQLKLDIDMSVTTENSGDGFTADLLIANTGLVTVPEPAGALLFTPLLILARRRKAAR
jgi:hypothetical protein